MNCTCTPLQRDDLFIRLKEELKLPDKHKSFGFQNFAPANIEDMYKELKGTKTR
jgi:hypothetical protein